MSQTAKEQLRREKAKRAAAEKIRQRLASGEKMPTRVNDNTSSRFPVVPSVISIIFVGLGAIAVSRGYRVIGCVIIGFELTLIGYRAAKPEIDAALKAAG